MKRLYHIMRPPTGAGRRLRAAHGVWMALALTGLGCWVGRLALLFSAGACGRLDRLELLQAYDANPLTTALNMLAPVLLIWLFYFLTRRAWAGYLGSFLPTIGVAVVNYYKIGLRGDPFLASDLWLAAEAGGIVGRYDLEVTNLLLLALASLAGGLLFAALLMPGGALGRRERGFGALSCLALLAVAIAGPYSSQSAYSGTGTSVFYIHPWSAQETFVARGSTYSFLHSIQDMFPDLPPGYRRERAEAELGRYPDSDIPEGQKVSVMGIMLEAFCDLTDFAPLAGQPGVAELYAPWHALEERSVSGSLLTNIFAAGTVDTEWGFLTGYSTHGAFRGPVSSYVWYLREQGYQTFGSHPYYGWFYDRERINQYLGFQDYWFRENHYGALVDEWTAEEDSDRLVAGELLGQLKERVQDGPCFSFSVTYQNHGPYDLDASNWNVYLTPEGSGLTEESCNVLNNYLSGLATTIEAMTGLTQELEAMDEPVVLVLFGDHKPWLGHWESVYQELDIPFYDGSPQGFANYYATPYLIWANSAAKEALGRDFTGVGGDFSPCFLMQEVFDQCGWEGPGFMKLAREMRDITPMLHASDLFWLDGAPADTLEGEALDFYHLFLRAQYYREKEVRK